MSKKVIDLTGQVFGTWTALSRTGCKWLCRCQCGAERMSPSKGLRKGHHRACDTCDVRACTQLSDMIGQRFGRLTVLSRAADRPSLPGRPFWLCKCDCGNEKAVLGKHLRRGAVLSCKCLTREQTTARNMTQNGLAKANRREYASWFAMQDRCNNHHDYAGRGITVCDRWRASFANFLSDMGPRPTGHSIERVNNDGNYEPSNCKWATRHEQARNTRRSRYVEVDGKRMVVVDWAKHTGIDVGLIYQRISDGWTEEEAVSTPARRITKSALYEATRGRKAA